MMRFLLLSNLVLFSLIFSSCSTSLHGFQKSGVSDILKNNSQLLFANDTTEKTYSTHITFLNQSLTGLMIVKPYISGDLRIVFITETGIKIFEMGIPLFSSRQSKVYYCIDPLNKKVILNTIKNDLSVLFMVNSSKLQLTEYSKKTDKVVVIHNKGFKRSVYNIQNNHITSATQQGLLSKVCVVKYFYLKKAALDSLQLKHTHLKMSIELHLIPD